MFDFSYETQAFFFDAASGSVGFAANWFLQSTILISIGLLVGWMLKSRGSAVQSVVYRTTLLAIFACPLATVALSASGFTGWSIDMPVAWERTAVVEKIDELETPFEVAVLPEVDSEPLESTSVSSLSANEFVIPPVPNSEFENVAEPEFVDPVIPVQTDDLELESSTVAAPVPPLKSSMSGNQISIQTFGFVAVTALMIWLAVALFFIVRLFVAWYSLCRLTRSSAPVEETLLRECDRLAKQIDVETPRLLRSPFLPSPCLAGIRRPTILLPAEDSELSIQDLLVHELAHLRRKDCHWNLLRQIATAVFFFQPLAWILSRRIEVTAEEVCDDFVVQFGGDRADYANRLVDIAELSTSRIAPVGVGVVSFRSMLSSRVSRILDTSRVISTRASRLLLLSVLGCGILGTAMTGLLGLEPRASESEPEADVLVVSSDETESIARFEGEVVDPDGNPLADAKIYLVYYVPDNGLLTPNTQPVATTDQNGHFEFTVDDSIPKKLIFEGGSIAAVKEEFGIAWCSSVVFDVDDQSREDYRERMKGLSPEYRVSMQRMLDRVGKPLQLVPDDEGVTGTILNIEGQPVEGAKLTLLQVNAGDDDTLDEWRLAASQPNADFYSAVQKTQNYINGPQVRSLVDPAVTDAEGKFQLGGVGNNRIVKLLVEGPGIATEKIYARTERGEEIVLMAERRYPRLGSDTYYSNEFKYIAAPTAEISGTVRDQKTGEPIVGATIKSETRHGETIHGWGQDFVRAVTDSEGRFRLNGMPIGEDNSIAVMPPEGDIAYLPVGLDTPLDGPDASLKLDIELKRGVWLEGVAIDKQSGEGLPGLVDYHLPAENPNYRLAASMGVERRGQMRANDEGKFRFAVPSGPAWVTFLSQGEKQYDRSKYIVQLDGTLKEVEKDIYNTSPSSMVPSNSNAIIAVDLPDEGVAKVKFELDDGGNLTGTVVDSAGKQIEDFSYTGQVRVMVGSWEYSNNGKIDLFNYDQNEGREIYLTSKDRKHAGFIRLTGKQASDFVVKLKPSGAVKGRLLDEEGQPITNCQLTNWRPRFSDTEREANNPDSPPLPLNLSHSRSPHYVTDSEGRFEIRGLVAGLEYRILATRAKDRMTPPDVDRLFDESIMVEPGEFKDLGDVKLMSQKSMEEMQRKAILSNQSNARKDKVQSTKVFGKVVDSDGKPVPNATVKVVRSRAIPYLGGNEHDEIAAMQTDRDGKFEVNVPPAERIKQFASGSYGQWEPAQIIASVSGYSLSWRKVDPNVEEQNLTLQINKLIGSPVESVRGRLVYPDGSPAFGVEVRVDQLCDTLSDDVHKWIDDESLTAAPADIYPKLANRLRSEHPSLPKKAITDDSGRFMIPGVNEKHLLTLSIAGQGVMHEAFSVVNYKMRSFKSNGSTFYGTEFEHTVTQGKSVRGSVVCSETGEALAGVKIAANVASSDGFSYMTSAPTVTDAKGQFTLEGLSPDAKFTLKITPPDDIPYFAIRNQEVPPSDGEQPAKVDIKLRPGVFVTGKVADSANGNPVSARVFYFPFKANLNAQKYRRFQSDINWTLSASEGTVTNETGEFRAVAIPGEGILTALCDDAQKWRAGFGAEQIKGYSPTYTQFDTHDHCSPRLYNGLVEINAPDDGSNYSKDLQVDRGQTVRMRPTDANGEQLIDVKILNGVPLNMSAGEVIQQGKLIEIFAMRPGEERQIVLVQPDLKLGRFVLVQCPDSDVESSTVDNVTLKPCAIVKGKLVDGDGKPVVGMKLAAVGGTRLWRANLESVETSEDGSFKFETLVPEATYQISQQAYGDDELEFASQLSLGSGETVDLGTIDISTKSKTGSSGLAKPGRLTPEPSGSPTASRPKAKSTSDNTISGVVVGADRKRVAGAKFYWMAHRSYSLEPKPPKLIATSNEKGEFKFQTPSVNLPADAPANWDYHHYIVVRAPGYGFAMVRPGNLLRQSREGQTVVGSLINAINGVKGAVVSLPKSGNSIRGRVVDIDGVGVAEAQIRVRWFDAPFDHQPYDPSGAKLASVSEEQWAKHIESLVNIIEPPQAQLALPSATTDSNGRFELKDVGANRLFILSVYGEQIEQSSLIARNQPGEKLTVKADFSSPGKTYVVHPQEILHVAGPSIPVVGEVVDLDSGEPIPNALIRATRLHGDPSPIRYQSEFVTRSDDKGKFRITGMPVGSGNKLVCLTPDSEVPYPIMGFTANSSQSKEECKTKVRMQRGVWVKGRVFDSETDAPMTGSIYAFYFRNPELEKRLPGIRESGLQWAYWTNLDGYFRIPVLPSRGILAYEHHPATYEEAFDRPIDQYPRGAGADSISGMEEHMRAFSTLPYIIMPDNYRRLVEIDLNGDEELVEIDMPLVRSKKVVVKPVWPDGIWVDSYLAWGASDGWGWQNHGEPEFEIKGLTPGKGRKVFVYNREKDLVGFTEISPNGNEAESVNAVEVQFHKAGTIVGRVLDADGEPVTDATLGMIFDSSGNWEGIWAPHPGKQRNPSSIPTDDEGRFKLTGIVPGLKYSASATANRKMYSDEMMPTHIGNVFTNVTVKPGETKDLGDLKLKTDSEETEDKDAAASTKTEDPTPAKQSDDLAVTVRTIILLPDGEPAKETHVALVGICNESFHGLVFDSGVADQDGSCTLTCRERIGPFDSHDAKFLIARKDGFAVGWRILSPAMVADSSPITIKFQEMGIIKGRLVDPEGQPAAGEKLQVGSVFDGEAWPKSREALIQFERGKGDSNSKPPQAWIQPVTTDSEGRFELTSVPKNYGVFLDLYDSEKFATQTIALNTGWAEQRHALDGTYRPPFKDVEPGEEALFTVSPAKIITGTVTYEDTDEPVPNAKISVWASTEEHGTMISIAGTTDADGKYRILPRPGIRFGVSAYPPSGTPYMGRNVDTIVWENTDTIQNVDIKLPRVTLVKGRVIEKGSGDPVADAIITYEGAGTDEPENAITGWQATHKTDADGRFSYAVPPGLGTLVVRKTDGNYVLQTMDSRRLISNKRGGSRYYANAFHRMEVEKDTETIEAEIQVLPGKTLRGVIVDEAGELAEAVCVLSRLKAWDPGGSWRGHHQPVLGGKFELHGLEPGEVYKVHFLDANRKLGATVELKAADEEVRVVLQPCGSAKARFIVEDEDKREKFKHMGSPTLSFTLNKGASKYDRASIKRGLLAADEDFNSNIDPVNYRLDLSEPKLDDDFRVTYPALIPGATYRLQTAFGDSYGYKEFVAKAGETLELGEFTPKFED